MKNGILFLAISLFLIGGAVAHAQAPSNPTWLMSPSQTQIEGTETYNVELTWRQGVVDASTPEATQFTIYRSPIGSFQDPEDYEKVATVDAVGGTGQTTFTDEGVVRGAYYYYVVGMNGEEVSGRSPLTQVFVPGWYCIRTTDPVLVITTSPKTVIEAGTTFEYTLFARHRSARVQGFVRYEIETGPDGMSINEQTGALTWDVPEDFSEAITIKLRAWSLDDEDAESFQEWSLRPAEDFELLVDNTTSVEEIVIEPTGISPNPASTVARMQLELGASANIRVYSLTGTLMFETQSTTSDVALDVAGFAPGRYTVVVEQGGRITATPLMVQR